MSSRAGRFNVIQDFDKEADPGYLTQSSYAIVAVVRLGTPLSFSRKKMGSITRDLSAGALLRAEKPLVITDDLHHLQVSHNKRSHTGQMQLALLATEVNYLIEILPGDHVFAWIVNNREDYERLLKQIDQGEPCNDFNDGLKFMGRIHNVRKMVSVDPGSGTKHAGYTISAMSFSELDAMFYYDRSLASKDVIQRDLGQWLARIGLDAEALFAQDTDTGVKENNVNDIVPALLDLIVGHGPSTPVADRVPTVLAAGGVDISAQPTALLSPDYAYIIPQMVGKLIGFDPGQASKGVVSYADVLELIIGVQNYPNKSGDWDVFLPEVKPTSSINRRVCPKKMLGTFLSAHLDFASRPLWQVLNAYLNPTINEMYTTLRVNSAGKVVPTVVMRQIPFTTESFTPDTRSEEIDNGSLGDVPFTRFLDLPQWEIPPVMIQHADIGRSDATRFNFVHIYGSNNYQTADVQRSIQEQMVNNPPIRDDLDIMRSGMRPYMTTVECFVSDQVGKVPGKWMALVADWMIGSHLTLNGSIECHGIQAPICVGDNLLFDGVAYHIEAVTHTWALNTNDGTKQWTTQLSLTNGMRADLPPDSYTDSPAGNETEKLPIYPGVTIDDNTQYDPGLTLEQGRPTSGGPSKRASDVVVTEDITVEDSQLSPQAQQDSPDRRSLPKTSPENL